MTWLLILSVATAVGAALWPDVTASLIFPVVLFVLLVAWLGRTVPEEDRSYIVRMLVLAFGLRLFCSYLVENLALIEKHDALKYHWIGFRIAEAAQSGRFPELYNWIKGSSHPGYYLLVGAVYGVFGPNILLGQNLNALASAFTIIPIYRLGREISDDARVARLASLAFAWFPNSIFWSTQLLKDSLIVLLEVLLIADLVRALNGRGTAGVFVRLVCSTLLLAELRFYLPILIYLGWGLGQVAFSWRTLRRFRGLNPAFVVAVIVIALLGASVTAGAWTRYLQLHEDIQSFRASTMGGGSDFGKDADLRSPLSIAKFLPTGITYFLAGPLPWEVSRLTQYLTWLDIPIWYPALLLGAAGMALLVRRRHAIPLVSICVALTLFYSVFLANLGTAYRMRLQVTPCFLIAAAWCRYHSRERAHLTHCL